MNDPVYSKTPSQGVLSQETRLCMPLFPFNWLSMHFDKSLFPACQSGLQPQSCARAGTASAPELRDLSLSPHRLLRERAGLEPISPVWLLCSLHQGLSGHTSFRQRYQRCLELTYHEESGIVNYFLHPCLLFYYLCMSV